MLGDATKAPWHEVHVWVKHTQNTALCKRRREYGRLHICDSAMGINFARTQSARGAFNYGSGCRIGTNQGLVPSADEDMPAAELFSPPGILHVRLRNA